MNRIDYTRCLNLSRLIKKGMSAVEDGGYNWDLRTATIAENRYKKWLYLCMKYGPQNIEIDKLQDLFWHLHILDTKNYVIDCQNIFGYFLHHELYPKSDQKTKITWEEITL